MYFICLIYFFCVKIGVDQDIEQILESVCKYNGKYNIIGVFWFDGDYFVQVLEGGCYVVSEIYYCIVVDFCYVDIELVFCDNVDSCLFYKWCMVYFVDIQENCELIIKYFVYDKFMLECMSVCFLLYVFVEGQLFGYQVMWKVIIILVVRWI